MRLLACAALVLVVGTTSGCKTFSDHTLRTRTALDARNPEKALSASNKALGVGDTDEIPTKLGKNGALLLLDRAMVLQAFGRHEESSRDFQVADKGVEILDFERSTADEIGRYMFSDSIGPYKARAFEKLMINSLNMVNYLVRGDLQGAKVEARRFAIMRRYLEESKQLRDSTLQATGPGSYFAGFSFERAREEGEALRFYDEALQAGAYPSLGQPVASLLKRSGFQTDRLRSVANEHAPEKAPNPETTGEVLVILNYGRVPAWVARRMPIGAAILAGALFLPPGAEKQARRMAGQGLVTWVNFPSPGAPVKSYPTPQVLLDGESQQLDAITDVDALLLESFEASKGRIIAAAITRTLTRAAIGAGVGVATGKSSDRSGLGVLAALVTQGAMAAADKPDTRSWATLPARMTTARRTVAAGKHTLEVRLLGRTHVYDIDVPAGQWVVINVTDLSRK